MGFNKQSITDKKRVVRRKHVGLIRELVRSRVHFDDEPINELLHQLKPDAKTFVPHAPNVLMLAGPNPREEIIVLRENFSKARIVAVDLEERPVQLAREAGADAVYQENAAELFEWFARDEGFRKMFAARCVHEGIESVAREDEQFDIIDLDVCGAVKGLRGLMRKAVKHALRDDGFLMATFSYGRNEPLAERFVALARGGDIMNPDPDVELQGLSLEALGRVIYASYGLPLRLRSVIGYKSTMPMCAALWERSSYVQTTWNTVRLEQLGEPEATAEEVRSKYVARALKAAEANRRNHQDVHTVHGVIRRKGPNGVWFGWAPDGSKNRAYVRLHEDQETATRMLGEIKAARGVQRRGKIGPRVNSRMCPPTT